MNCRFGGLETRLSDSPSRALTAWQPDNRVPAFSEESELTILPLIRRAVLRGALVAIASIATTSVIAQPGRPAQGSGPWSFSVKGGAAHQFETDLDSGGSFSVNRLYIQPGVSYAASARLGLSFNIGYGYDGYDFSNATGLGNSPWENINSWRVSAPVRYQAYDRWSLFAVPSVRWYYESGASASDSMTGGVLVAAAYKVSDSLSIGPGVGVFSQLEDDALIFPILAIQWQITDRLDLSTGQGLAATVGPGLTLGWKQNEKLRFGLTGRLDKTRFRLDRNGPVANGVGEDRSYGLFASADYRFNPHARVTAFGGASFGGELKVEDDTGRQVRKEDYDTAPMLGLTFELRM